MNSGVVVNRISRFCELHVHLEGCVWPAHFRNWWKKSKFLFPPPGYARQDKTPFDSFLEHLRFAYNFLNTKEAYSEVAALYARNCAAQKIRYAELQINLVLLNTWRISLTSVLKSIAKRMRSVNNEPVLRYIVDLPWQFPSRNLLGIVDKMPELYDLGVRAISMGGDERLAVPEEVADVFAAARSAGLKVHCHAGETTDSEHALRIVERLQPDRIVHGVLIADWITARGSASPPIDVCLSSNMSLNVVDNLEAHPLRTWWKAGVPVSLSTDDPAIFSTNLDKEYRLAGTICPEILESSERIRSNWIKAAVDPEALMKALKLDQDQTAKAAKAGLSLKSLFSK